MFRCQVTGRVTRPGEKMHRVTVETRDRVYTEKRIIDGFEFDVPVGEGYEIVREVCCSAEGLRILEEQEAQYIADQERNENR